MGALASGWAYRPKFFGTLAHLTLGLGMFSPLLRFTFVGYTYMLMAMHSYRAACVIRAVSRTPRNWIDSSIGGLHAGFVLMVLAIWVLWAWQASPEEQMPNGRRLKMVLPATALAFFT